MAIVDIDIHHGNGTEEIVRSGSLECCAIYINIYSSICYYTNVSIYIYIYMRSVCIIVAILLLYVVVYYSLACYFPKITKTRPGVASPGLE